jgi:hypothetical protein
VTQTPFFKVVTEREEELFCVGGLGKGGVDAWRGEMAGIGARSSWCDDARGLWDTKGPRICVGGDLNKTSLKGSSALRGFKYYRVWNILIQSASSSVLFLLVRGYWIVLGSGLGLGVRERLLDRVRVRVRFLLVRGFWIVLGSGLGFCS